MKNAIVKEEIFKAPSGHHKNKDGYVIYKAVEFIPATNPNVRRFDLEILRGDRYQFHRHFMSKGALEKYLQAERCEVYT